MGDVADVHICKDSISQKQQASIKRPQLKLLIALLILLSLI